MNWSNNELLLGCYVAGFVRKPILAKEEKSLPWTYTMLLPGEKQTTDRFETIGEARVALEKSIVLWLSLACLKDFS